VPDEIAIDANSVFKLKSVVFIELGENNMALGNTVGIIETINPEEGRFSQKCLFYDPVGSYNIIQEENRKFHNQPMSYIDMDSSPIANTDDRQEISFRTRAEETGTIFIYRNERGQLGPLFA